MNGLEIEIENKIQELYVEVISIYTLLKCI